MRIPWAILSGGLIVTLVNHTASSQDHAKVYPTYSNTIIRKAFPQYVVENKPDGRLFVYSTYSNTIIRKPFPDYIVENGKVYPTYTNTIFRKPFPVEKVDSKIKK
jgi:hypothetical protein